MNKKHSALIIILIMIILALMLVFGPQNHSQATRIECKNVTNGLAVKVFATDENGNEKVLNDTTVKVHLHIYNKTYNKTITKSLETNSNGELIFNNITEGEYQVETWITGSGFYKTSKWIGDVNVTKTTDTQTNTTANLSNETYNKYNTTNDTYTTTKNKTYTTTKNKTYTTTKNKTYTTTKNKTYTTTKYKTTKKKSSNYNTKYKTKRYVTYRYYYVYV